MEIRAACYIGQLSALNWAQTALPGLKAGQVIEVGGLMVPALLRRLLETDGDLERALAPLRLVSVLGEPLATLFQGPTIEQLACVLRRRPGSLPWSPMVPIQSGGSRRPFFCVHPAGGIVHGYIALAQHLGPN